MNRRRIATGILAILATATLAACAEGARPDRMALTPTSATLMSQIGPGYQAFRVIHVDGGGQTNPLWMSSVSSEDFKKALESSLHALGLLSVDPTMAKIAITANLEDLQRPLAGFDASVTSRVRYSAKMVASQQVVFDDTVAATGTAKLGESLLGVRRLQKANEASMKANIQEFVHRLLKSSIFTQGTSFASDSSGAP